MIRVRQFLEHKKLGSYAPAFQDKGYDDADFLMQLDANEAEIVAQTVGMKPGHAHKYVSLAKQNADLPSIDLPTTNSVSDLSRTNRWSSLLLHTSLAARLGEASAVAEKYEFGFERDHGHVGQIGEEVALLRGLAMAPGVRTICEIGFLAGHSAILFLEGLSTTLHDFDLPRAPFANASRTLLQKLYPGRITFHDGDSKFTVPEFSRRAASAGLRCDLWFVDGAHGFDLPRRDLGAALSAARPGSVIVADDCTTRFPRVPVAWTAFVNAGIIVPDRQRTNTPYGRMEVRKPEPVGLKGWCVGWFNASACASPAGLRSPRRPRECDELTPATEGRSHEGSAATAWSG